MLQAKLDWTPLSAWGLGITISCQVSNAIVKVMDPENDINNNLDDDEKKWKQGKTRARKRKERRIGGASAGNEKKNE